jgi:hypothetical protein
MGLERVDRGLIRWRKILGYAAGIFTVCLVTVLYAVGDGELVRIARASFGEPVCWMEMERVKNPLAPETPPPCIYRVIDPNSSLR